MRQTILAALLAPTLLAGAAARAQVETREGIYLQNQILELRQQLQGLQQLGSQAAPTPYGAPPVAPAPGAGPEAAGGNDLAAQLLVRVSALEDQMRALQGKISELEHQQQRDREELDKKIGDLAFKLGGAPPAGEAAGAAGAVPGLAPPPAEAPPPPPKPARRTPEVALKAGSAALARRDYAAAEAAAREVIDAGNTARLWDARYLLARSQAGAHKYKEAAASFYVIYKAFPKSVRGGESLLGVANALVGLGDKTAACQAAAKVAAEFSREATLKSGAASVRKRAGC